MDYFAKDLIKKALSTPRTKRELLNITKLSERTLRYNLSILKKKNLIFEYKNFRDMRKKVYLWLKKL